MAYPFQFSDREVKSAQYRTPHQEDCFINNRIKNSSSEFRMAAEAISKHFQRQYRPRDESFNVDAVNGDFARYKPFNSKKSNIYVHEFYNNIEQNPVNCESHQNQLHRHLYNHEAVHNNSERIKSRSFQDSYMSKKYRSRTNSAENPMHTNSNLKSEGFLKNRNTIAKLEESYWANWKPNRTETYKQRKASKAHYRVIRKQPHESSRKSESSSSSENEDNRKTTKDEDNEKDNDKSVVKTETKCDAKTSGTIQAKKSEEIQVPADLSQNNLDSTVVQQDECANENDKLQETEEAADEVPPLKHTDSLILAAKRQSIDKPHYQQPRCIKLFRKPIITGSRGTITKGGSYPLKSAIKKEIKTVIKGNIRLGRPGSPIMIQINKGKKGN